MNAEPNSLHETLLSLRVQYLQALPQKLERLREMWACIVANPESREPRRELSRLTHALAGSGGTFGCPEVSELAAAISVVLRDSSGCTLTIDPVLRIRMGDLFDALDGSAAQSLEHAPASIDALPQPVMVASTAPMVYVLDDDRLYAEQLAAHLNATGFQTRVFEDVASLAASIGMGKPDALILDIVLAEGARAGIDAAAGFGRELAIPVLMISARDDIEARLEAVRAGATHYLVKPVRPERVIECLRQRDASTSMVQCRVMMVDDDVPLLSLYSQQLQAAGMTVAGFSDPLRALEQLAGFQPDLIVLDVDMPEINGVEMAAVIRQMEDYDHVPIVFLSADDTIQTRLAAMRLGADDFLLKPVGLRTLVETLVARARRARVLGDGRIGLQRALRDLEFMRQAMNEHAIISRTDASGRITYANRRFVELSGFSEQELLGQSHRLLKSGQHPDELYRKLWATITSGKVWHGTVVNRARDGHLYHLSTTIVPKLDEAGLPEQYLAIRTDVTHIQHLKDNLAQQAERLALALAATASHVWEWNLAFGQVIANQTGAVSDGNPGAWSENMHPDDVDGVIGALLRHLDGQSPAYVSEHRVRNAVGGWDWVREEGKIVEHDLHGDPVRLVGTTQVITERVALRQQERMLQQQLAQAAKMESIGHLAAGIAHDFNNLLGAILGYTELGGDVLERDGDAAQAREYLGQIALAGTRAKELVAQMLLFSRLTPDAENEEIPVTQLQPVVKEVVHLLRASIPSGVQINYEVADESLCARIRAVHLHQILLNLAVNARDAVGDYGHIDVRVERLRGDGHCDSCHAPYFGEFVAVSVRDTGAGIPDSLRDKIFEPFFTSKDPGRGTGMGLPVVHGIVHGLGGHIRVRSEPGNGTEFRILLPLEAVATTANPAPAAEPLAADALSGLRVMVVDDEPVMAAMVQELMTVCGASVVTFSDPREALRAFEIAPERVDLVITDQTMPHMSGTAMAREMRARRDDLAVILCTGYSGHTDPAVLQRDGILGPLYKPLDMNRLLQLCREVQDALPDMPMQRYS